MTRVNFDPNPPAIIEPAEGETRLEELKTLVYRQNVLQGVVEADMYRIGELLWRAREAADCERFKGQTLMAWVAQNLLDRHGEPWSKAKVDKTIEQYRCLKNWPELVEWFREVLAANPRVAKVCERKVVSYWSIASTASYLQSADVALMTRGKVRDELKLSGPDLDKVTRHRVLEEAKRIAQLPVKEILAIKREAQSAQYGTEREETWFHETVALPRPVRAMWQEACEFVLDVVLKDEPVRFARASNSQKYERLAQFVLDTKEEWERRQKEQAP